MMALRTRKSFPFFASRTLRRRSRGTSDWASPSSGNTASNRDFPRWSRSPGAGCGCSCRSTRATPAPTLWSTSAFVMSRPSLPSSVCRLMTLRGRVRLSCATLTATGFRIGTPTEPDAALGPPVIQAVVEVANAGLVLVGSERTTDLADAVRAGGVPSECQLIKRLARSTMGRDARRPLRVYRTPPQLLPGRRERPCVASPHPGAWLRVPGAALEIPQRKKRGLRRRLPRSRVPGLLPNHPPSPG